MFSEKKKNIVILLNTEVLTRFKFSDLAMYQTSGFDE